MNSLINRIIFSRWGGQGWLSGVYHGDDVEWELRAKIDLTLRSDTGRINSSPNSVITPVMKIQHGCEHTILIPGTALSLLIIRELKN